MNRVGPSFERAAGSAASPSISVVIRALNEGRLIGLCLEKLRAQARGPELEIIVVDSGSSDDTPAIARHWGAAVIDIAPENFHYSGSLNLGISRARGDLVVVLSAHSIPVEADWLERMIAPFADATVAGVCCRQRAWPNADWNELRRIRETFDGTKRVFDRADCGGLMFSNAASCIRRHVWEREQFRLPAAEDVEWAQRVIEAGYVIVYEPAASVMHSHSDSIRKRAHRLIELGAAADIVQGRTRSRLRTAREAAGLVARELGEIRHLDEPRRRKIRFAARTTLVAALFLLEFPPADETLRRAAQSFRAGSATPAQRNLHLGNELGVEPRKEGQVGHDTERDAG